MRIKKGLSAISCDPPCKDGNVRFTTVSLKALSDQCLKLIILIVVSLQK